MKKRILVIFGTRPEAIKMAPVVLGFKNSGAYDVKVCVTAQHREMLDQVLNIFEIKPDYDLNVMSPGQDLFDITAKVILSLRDVLRDSKPDIVFVHGDTTTCFVSALAAFYENIPVAHVEAGLRTGDMRAPFPEEANRTLVGRIARYHFAPTTSSQNNLLKENVSGDLIHVTGNTVIDALFIVRDRVRRYNDEFWLERFGDILFDHIANNNRRMILITGHRRENFGQGFIDLCTAIKTIATNHPDWDLIYPVHLNPNVQGPVFEILDGIDNVFLIAPQDYEPFVWLMDKCDLILTDSGGIQEEGPSLGKPVLVMRDVTERPEAVDAGTVMLVGTDQHKIVDSVVYVLGNQEVYKKMACAHNPYGDGCASNRIVEAMIEYLS